MILKTSEVPFEASPHGSERRLQRNIKVRDLQAAVKYGVKERGFPHPRTGEQRWKFTFAEVVYITDDSCTKEITSYALPIPLAKKEINDRTEHQYLEARRRLAKDPQMITSLTVLVVDKSASMKASDMEGHRYRYRGVYFGLAEEFTATQLSKTTSGALGGSNISYTDVVTLIEMRDEPTIIFEFEPVSWILYNKFVDLAETNNARSHGNYYPAIIETFRILEKCDNGKCALSVLFLSDGKTSDYKTQAYFLATRSRDTFPHNMTAVILKNSLHLKSRLHFSTVGFGSDVSQFQTLRDMVDCARIGGAKAEFTHSNLDATSLGTALSSVVSSTTTMRSLLSRLHVTSEDGERKLSTAAKEEWNPEQGFDPQSAFILNGKVSANCSRAQLQYVEISGKHTPQLKKVPFLHPHATGFAFRKQYFESGAERIVYLMTEIDGNEQPVGLPLVAKESKYLLQCGSTQYQRFQENFHLTFLKTQCKAQNLAEKFNKKLNDLNVDPRIPRISFLDCSVYRTDDYQQTMLAEQRLDVRAYRKWNNNAGGVDGIARQNSAAMVQNIMGVQPMNATAPLTAGVAKSADVLAVIAESDEDDDSESDCDEEPTFRRPQLKSAQTLALEAQIMVEDIPQAFSHYTYVFTKRDKLVCDVQGVLDLTGEYPRYLLTDPCIHSDRDYKGKKYGRTNKGHKGAVEFFQTHHCNPVCELLGFGHRK